jgi:DnaK suppressor protein
MRQQQTRRRHQSTREQAAAAAALPPVERPIERMPVEQDERSRELLASLTEKREGYSIELVQLRQLIRKGTEGADGADPEELTSLEDAHGTTATRISLLDRYIANIDRARLALENGTYGICIDCEQPISAKRLEAMLALGSAAERCIDCQTRRESEGVEDTHWTPKRDPWARAKDALGREMD